MLKNVKDFILFSTISLLTFTSCKKDNADASNPGISVSIDGKQTTFNFGAKAIVISVTGGYGIAIKGNKKALLLPKLTYLSLLQVRLP